MDCKIRTRAAGRNRRSIPAALLASFVLIGCSKPEVEFDRRASPDDAAELVVTVTEPALPHGKHTVRIYVRAGEEMPLPVAETTMENDGVPFTKKNIGIRWTSNQVALVCLRPTDLADQGVRIYLRPEPRAEIREGC